MEKSVLKITAIAARATFRLEGFHQWIDAPARLIFLRNLHRHSFHVSVVVRERHNERDVEIITLQEDAKHEFFRMSDPLIMSGERSPVNSFGNRSCETMCEELAERLTALGYYVKQISVMEDGENGAILDFEQNLGSKQG